MQGGPGQTPPLRIRGLGSEGGHGGPERLTAGRRSQSPMVGVVGGAFLILPAFSPHGLIFHLKPGLQLCSLPPG